MKIIRNNTGNKLERDIEPTDHPAEVYNQLYQLYSNIIIDSLGILEQKYYDNMEEPSFLVAGQGYP